MKKQFLVNAEQKETGIEGSYWSSVLEKTELIDCTDKNRMCLKMKITSSVSTFVCLFVFPLCHSKHSQRQAINPTYSEWWSFQLWEWGHWFTEVIASFGSIRKRKSLEWEFWKSPANRSLQQPLVLAEKQDFSWMGGRNKGGGGNQMS